MKKTLTVTDLRNINSNKECAFRVKKIQNSVYFHVGQLLSEDEVGKRCENGCWTVNIVGKK